MYQNVEEEQFIFFDEKLSKSTKFHYMEPCFYTFFEHIVHAMNTFIQKRHNHSENCITVKVSCFSENSKS